MNEVVLKSQALLGEINQNFSIMTFNKFTEEVKYDYDLTYQVNCYAILMIMSGESKYVVDFNQIVVREGDVVIIYPGQVFHCLTPRQVEGVMISFSEKYFEDHSNTECFKGSLHTLKTLSQATHLSISAKRREDVYSLLRLMEMNDSNSSEEKFTLIRQHLLSALFQVLKFESQRIELHEVVGAECKLAMRFKNLVQQRISIKNNVEYFCNELNVSKSTLQKATRVVFQKSPKDIIQKVLLLEAQRLLYISKNRVQEIAYLLGFTDPTNFTKFFKKSVGRTPEAFRKQQYKN